MIPENLRIVNPMMIKDKKINTIVHLLNYYALSDCRKAEDRLENGRPKVRSLYKAQD
jgi:hypothetical protein